MNAVFVIVVMAEGVVVVVVVVVATSLDSACEQNGCR